MNEAPIDMMRLSKVFEADREFISGIFQTYLDSTREHMVKLRTDIQSGDASESSYEAHIIKGSSENIGADHMGELAGVLEEDCKSGKLDGAGPLCDSLTEEFERITAFIESYLAE